MKPEIKHNSTIKIAFYHSGCTDGLFSAHGIWEKYKGSVRLVPVNYKQSAEQSPEAFIHTNLVEKFQYAKRFSAFAYELLDLNNNYRDIEIFFLDFAPDIEKLEYLAATFKSVVVLDHHKSAMDRYLETYPHHVPNEEGVTIYPKGNVCVRFTNNQCGAYLTETYFHSQREIPYYIELVNDYDMWIKADKNSDPFVAGVSAMNPGTIKELNAILTTGGIHKVIELGEHIQRTREKRSKGAARFVTPVEITHKGKSYRGGFVNAEHDISSMLGNLLVKDNEYDIAVVYNIRSSNDVGCSVRSRKDMPSVFLSEAFGGGGHNAASGFSTTLDIVTAALSSGELEIVDERESNTVAV